MKLNEVKNLLKNSVFLKKNPAKREKRIEKRIV